MPLSSDSHAALCHRGGFQTDLYPDQTLFERIGGRAVVFRVVDGLYDRIEEDCDIRPMFTATLRGEREKQKAFFEEWLGGKPLYTQHHAYSGMMARHSHIHITDTAAERWLAHMTASLNEVLDDASLTTEILNTLRPLALGLINEGQAAENTKHLRCHRVNRWRKPKELAAKGRLKVLKQVIKADPGLLKDPLLASDMLREAVLRDHRETITFLLDQGVDIDRATASDAVLWMTPLCVARWKKHHDLAEYLLARGAAYDIFSACFLGDLDSVQSFVGAAPELVDARDPACDFLDVTPLYHAVSSSQVHLAQYLLHQGANPGPAAARLVRSAADNGVSELVQLLLAHGADATLIGPGKWVKRTDIAKMLLSHGADVNCPAGKWVWNSCTGNNSQKDDPEYVQALLNCGAKIDTRLRGASPLHYAAKSGHTGTLNVLLKNSAEIDAVNNEGETPLFYAFKAGKRADIVTVCRLLLEAGASMDHKDHRGRTPWDAARRLRRPEVQEINRLFESHRSGPVHL